MHAATARIKRATRRLRRDEIETAALRAVLKHGFPGSSLRRVAKEAGLPLSILHYYYRDKDELMDRAAQLIFDAATAELEKGDYPELDTSLEIVYSFFHEAERTTHHSAEPEIGRYKTRLCNR